MIDTADDLYGYMRYDLQQEKHLHTENMLEYFLVTHKVLTEINSIFSLWKKLMVLLHKKNLNIFKKIFRTIAFHIYKKKIL